MNKNIYRPPVNKEQDKKIQRKLDKNAILRLCQFQENTVCSVNAIPAHKVGYGSQDWQGCMGGWKLGKPSPRKIKNVLFMPEQTFKQIYKVSGRMSKSAKRNGGKTSEVRTSGMNAGC